MILSIFLMALIFILPLVSILVILIVITNQRYKVKKEEYEQSTYFKSTHIPYHQFIHDKGRIGEKIIYDRLSSYEQTGARFLFNVYLNKENGKTSEVDVIMLHSSGIYVFESKQYSGWIFGSANQKTWTQTLNKNTKEKFYNPLFQNRTHIKYLTATLPEQVPSTAYRSIIVFSDNCQLKTKIDSSDTEVVIQQVSLQTTINSMSCKTPNLLTQEQVLWIYDKLYPLTQVSDEIKAQHISDINAKKQ